MAEKSGGVAWLTLLVTAATLVVTGLTALSETSNKRETNGVARAAVIKDLMASLLTESSPRGKMLAFEALLSSLPVSSANSTGGVIQPISKLVGADRQADADQLEFASLSVFLRQLWQTETDRTVRCYYYERLTNLKIVIRDNSAGQTSDGCFSTNPLASIASPQVSIPDVATIRSPEPASTGPTPPADVPPRVFEKRSGPKPSGTGKAFSDKYELCSDPLPEPTNTVIVSSDFFLLGDRSCGAWSICESSIKEPTKVCWKFAMQGHDERPFNPISMSEGVLRYSVKSR